MTYEQLVFAAVAGVLSSAMIAAIGVWASRKFGLPGIARQLDAASAQLISTLQGSVNELREKNEDLQKQFSDSETSRKGCEREIGRLRGDLRATERELLDLYRRTGEAPPVRLTSPRKEPTQS